ncbi:MAG TPA: hypothetical protein VFS47_09595 [Steroidobacteraceae bacterium]|nr:hypothetical protein [Steroidobacteraceae bacterium]
MSVPAVATTDVVRIADVDGAAIRALLARFGLDVEHVQKGAEIPGSYWGEAEAGLVGDTLSWRDDTPVHSVLHEACHFICMDDVRRRGLNRDAGGDDPEENAVCYLQVILADHIPGFGRDRLMQDMDAWGYSFRLGSTKAWFENDAEDARQWLVSHGVLAGDGGLTWRCRA